MCILLYHYFRQELWEEDQQLWYYYNNVTEETLWVPSKEGYTKYDGMLVLASGQVRCYGIRKFHF